MSFYSCTRNFDNFKNEQELVRRMLTLPFFIISGVGSINPGKLRAYNT
jgi:hypothetical protein